MKLKTKKIKAVVQKMLAIIKLSQDIQFWPSAYASGALVKCRKVGAANWGNSRKEEVEYEVNEGMAVSPRRHHRSTEDEDGITKTMDKRRKLTPEQEAGIKRYRKMKDGTGA